jgi:hypothetical protein
MAVDAEDDALYAASSDGGVWVFHRSEEGGKFEPLLEEGRLTADLTQVRRDPAGGIYLFGSERLVHYRTRYGFTPVSTVSQLEEGALQITDVAAAPNGDLWVAAGNGLYQYSVNGTLHLSRDDGIWGNVVRTVFVDHKGRCWFATRGYVGYFTDTDEQPSLIQIEPMPTLISEETQDSEGQLPPVTTESPSVEPHAGDAIATLLEYIKELLPF